MLGRLFKDERSSGPTRTSPMYTVSPAERLVVVKFGQVAGLEEIKSYAAALISDPAFRSDFSEIVDLSDVQELRLSAGDALQLADTVDSFSADAKRAFVARTPMQVHAARMHQVLRSEERIRIFASQAEARAWIIRP